MKKKVLIFIDWYLPGFKAGGPIRSVANLVEHLAGEFDFSIITRDTDYCETLPYPNVKSDQWNRLSEHVRVYYISQDSLKISTIRSLLRKTDFDVVYLNGIYSFYFTLLPLLFLRKKCDKRIVIAARGMLSEGSLSVKKRKKQFFIRAVRTIGLFDDVVFHSTTESEKEEIRSVFGNSVKVRTAGNLPVKTSISGFSEKQKDPGLVKLVNVARISPEKNLLYALEVLEKVKTKVEFDFYGPVYNEGYWNECKAVIARLPQHIQANYKGSLDSEKVAETLKHYHFLFMPSTGENFGHIILQSLSAGCPVIISDRTPWNGLKEKGSGWDLSLSDQHAFVSCIEACAEMDSQAYNRSALAAFQQASAYNANPLLPEQNRQLFL